MNNPDHTVEDQRERERKHPSELSKGEIWHQADDTGPDLDKDPELQKSAAAQLAITFLKKREEGLTFLEGFSATSSLDPSG